MKAQRRTSKRVNGGKSKPSKDSIHKSKSNRFRHVRPLTPAHFVDMIEHINDGLVVLDKNWHYVYVNQKAAAMLQRQKPADLIGKHIWTEYPEGVGQPFHLAYEKAMREQVAVVFEEHYAPWELWFENRVYPSPDSLMILFTDITQRKRMERLLEERQHLLQKIVDTEPGTVYIYDLEERRNVYVNRHWLSVFGYTAEETQAMGEEIASKIFHPDDLPLIAEHHANWRQASEGEIRNFEYRVRSRAGEWLWVLSREAPFTRNESGEVKQILGIAYDVTEQHMLQEAILKEKELSEGMLNSLPGVFYFYDHSGKFLRWNKNFEMVSGYSAEEIAQMHPLDFFEGREKEYIAERIQQVFECGESDAEAYFIAKNHQLFPYYFTGKRIDIEGQPHLIGMGIDIGERKRAEEALRANEARYRAVVENQTEFIVRWKPDGTRTFVNEAYCRYFRLTPQEALSSKFMPLIADEDRAAVQAKISRLLAGEAHAETDLHRVIMPDGIIGWQEWVDQAICDESGQIVEFQSVGRDVTERRRTEEALAISEAEFRALFAAMDDVLLLIDREGVYRKVAPTNSRLLQKPREELLGRTMKDVFPAEQAQMFINAIQQVLESKQTARIEYQLRIEGRDVWFDASLSPMDTDTILWMARDITERKHAEQENRKLLHILGERVKELTALHRSARIQQQEGADILAVLPELTSLLPPAFQYPDVTVARIRLGQAEAMTPGFAGAISLLRTDFTTADGQTGSIEAGYTQDRPLETEGPFLTEERALIDTLADMLRTSYDRKCAEEKLRQLNEELEGRIAARTEELAAAMIKAQESDRLKSAFLATMSHELRTPLNSIIGFTGVILQGLAGPLNEEQSKQLNMTRDSARHLLALINDVLDLSKIEAGQLEIVRRPFDMRQSIENALRVVQPLARKKDLKLRTSIGLSVGTINQDKRRVEQVLINLVNNAIKFTERGEVSIDCQCKEGRLETCVRDTGMGIKSEDMDRLFKPFQQIESGLTRHHEGTGLGLSICKHLVVAMDGEITVESQWGVGSTFKFILPV